VALCFHNQLSKGYFQRRDHICIAFIQQFTIHIYLTVNGLFLNNLIIHLHFGGYQLD